jgi:thiol:disulfide interchange protein DsbD
MILAGFMFLFALSLFGVYDIGFLAGSASVMDKKKKSGLGGAFVSGVTATLVATPCTAPFMGAALGYSLTQPAVVSLMIYTSLGLGMAAPYLVLAAFPRLLKFVPKPGRWMETFKQAMGFILAATVIWLGWVLASQAGATALVILMGVLLLLSVAAWIYGRWGSVASTPNTRRLSRVLATLLLIISLGFGSVGINAFSFIPDSTSGKSGNGIAWQEFSSDRLEILLDNDQAVFIDFTAAWCLSCQVNEKIAFSSDAVRQKFTELNIVPLKADWTNRSGDIASALARYGRNSVPLYVLYAPGNVEPTLLPEILTPGIVLDALDKIESNTNTL